MSLTDRILVIEARDLIREVATQWAHQYPHGSHADKITIGERLAALNAETATADEVEAIIGNDSWTTITCGVCEEHVSVCVRLGGPPDYDSDTFYVCPRCVRVAAAKVAGR